MRNSFMRNDDWPKSRAEIEAGAWQLAGILAAKVFPQCQDGFTFCPWRRQHAFLRRRANVHLYVVSLYGFENVFPGLPTERETFRWLLKTEGVLKRRGHYIGGWRKGELFFLDVSVVVRRLDRALLIAKFNMQSTIYHPATGKPIDVV